MPFWRKDKAEPREETIETREEKIKYPIVVRVTEETGITEGRLLVVENTSESPLTNVTIKLSPGSSDLGSEIRFPIIKPREKKERTFKSDVKAFSHKLEFDAPKALVPGDKTKFSIVVSSEIPTEGYVRAPLEAYKYLKFIATAGEARENAGIERSFSLSGGEAKLEVETSPTGEQDPRKVGGYEIELRSDRSMSGIEITEIVAHAHVAVSIEKESLGGDERRVTMHVENTNDFHVEISGFLKAGLEEEEFSSLLAPGEAKDIALYVKSVEEPTVEHKVTATTSGEVYYESIYKASAEAVEVPILKGTLSVEAIALHNEIMKEILSEKEIPSVGESTVMLKIKFTSIGTALVDGLQRDVKASPNIVTLKEISTNLGKPSVSGDSRELETRPLKKGESLNVEEIYIVRPSAEDRYLEFNVNFSARSSDTMLMLEKSDKIEIRALRRLVTYNIKPQYEEERIIYVVEVENSGQMPALEVKLVAKIPEEDFEVSVSPKEDGRSKDTRIRNFDVIKPGEKKTVKISLRPISEGASFDSVNIYVE